MKPTKPLAKPLPVAAKPKGNPISPAYLLVMRLNRGLKLTAW